MQVLDDKNRTRGKVLSILKKNSKIHKASNAEEAQGIDKLRMR